MEAYNKWFLTNATQVANVDSTLRSLTLFAPGQLNQIELVSEAAAAALQALGLYNDRLVAGLVARSPGAVPSAHARYIAALMAESKTYTVAAYALALSRSSELFAEMAARHYLGPKGRWKAILGIESGKVVLRLVMLAASGRALCAPPVFGSEIAPAAVEALAKATAEVETKYDVKLKSSPPLPTNVSQFLQSKALRLDDLRSDINQVRGLSPLGLSGEILGILRPLIYALILYRYRNRPRSWVPWSLGMLIEALARRLTRDALLQSAARVSGLEHGQLHARTSSLLWWLLRGPAYEQGSRPLISRFSGIFENVPVLSLVSVLVKDYLYLIDTYYFASASA